MAQQFDIEALISGEIPLPDLNADTVIVGQALDPKQEEEEERIERIKAVNQFHEDNCIDEYERDYSGMYMGAGFKLRQRAYRISKRTKVSRILGRTRTQMQILEDFAARMKAQNNDIEDAIIQE